MWEDFSKPFKTEHFNTSHVIFIGHSHSNRKEGIFFSLLEIEQACWLWYQDICLSLSAMKAWSVLRVQIGSAFHSDTCMSLMTPVPEVCSSLASPLYNFPNLNSLPLSKGPHLVPRTLWLMHSNVQGHWWRQSVRAKCLPHVFVYWLPPMEDWAIQRHPGSPSYETSTPFSSHICITGTLKTIWDA